MLNAETIIIVPCYNEARRLSADSFTGYDDGGNSVGFLFVNDGSTDETRQVLERLCAEDASRFAMLDLEHNAGKAEAVRRGMLQAMEWGAAFVGYWDADLATPLEEIASLREALEQRPEVILAMGSRVRLMGRLIERRWARHYFGRVFATVAGVMLGLPVYDTQCGAKMFRLCDETRALFAEQFLGRWVFDVELIARLIAGRRGSDLSPLEEAIVEVPLLTWRDVAGSKLRARHFFAVGYDLLRIQLKYFTGS